MRDGHRRFLERLRRKPAWQVENELFAAPKKSGWRRGQKKPERFKFIAPDQVALILKAADAARDERASLAIRLSFYLGLRISEVADLRLGDFDMKEGKVWVRTLKRGKRMRTRADRTTRYWLRDEAHRPVFPVRIPASKEVAATVDRVLELARQDPSAAGFVFPGRISGHPITARWICARFGRYRRKAGVDSRYTFHSLRHANATLTALGTKDPLVVRDQLRHANISQSDRYMRAAWDYSDEIGRSVSLKTSITTKPTPTEKGKQT